MPARGSYAGEPFYCSVTSQIKTAQGVSVVIIMILDAYGEPEFHEKEYQKEQLKEFSNKWFSSAFTKLRSKIRAFTKYLTDLTVLSNKLRVPPESLSLFIKD